MMLELAAFPALLLPLLGEGGDGGTRADTTGSALAPTLTLPRKGRELRYFLPRKGKEL